jgi:hypothetical protein
VTNLASRLADEATGGQILITQRLHADVEDMVDVEPIGEVKLAGVQHSVAAFNVVAVREPAAELSSVESTSTASESDHRLPRRQVLGTGCGTGARLFGPPTCAPRPGRRAQPSRSAHAPVDQRGRNSRSMTQVGSGPRAVCRLEIATSG